MLRRLLVFDRTCITDGRHLSPLWSVGAFLYRVLGRVDASCGVADWDEALAWLGKQKEPIAEVQYWGHGTWGAALVGRDVLDARALAETHRRRAALDALAERLAPGALIWFRTCETLGAAPGIDFAERLSDVLGARVAGHTHDIAVYQSGLHGLLPGVRADWSPEEGLAEGTAAAPRRSYGSSPSAPRTITCFTGHIPRGWLAGEAREPDPARAVRGSRSRSPSP